jgi:hypothetical protein
MGETISFGEFGRRRGISRQAVSKGYRSGRLRRCLGRDAHGHPVIVDVALAEREWQESAQRARDTKAPPAAGRTRKRRPIDGDSVLSWPTLAEAQRHLVVQRERKLRLENDAREGRLIAVELVKRKWFETSRIIRESILNLPARIGSTLFHERDEVRFLILLEAALREALNATADALLVQAAGDDHVDGGSAPVTQDMETVDD